MILKRLLRGPFAEGKRESPFAGENIISQVLIVVVIESTHPHSEIGVIELKKL